MHRKLFSLALVALGAITAAAEDTDGKMVFQLTDGSTQCVTSKNLVITFAETDLVAESGSEKVIIPAASLARFYFGNPTDVAQLGADESPVDIYSVEGIHMGLYPSLDAAVGQLPKGAYVVKNSVSSFKIVVK